MNKGSVGRTTPAVSASERRKSLKLVRGMKKYEEREAVNKRGRWVTQLCSSDDVSSQDCLLGSARCVLFQCPLHSFSGQAVLNIHARLWNSSFIEVKHCVVLPHGFSCSSFSHGHSAVVQRHDGSSRQPRPQTAQ